jgi:inner membrane protein
MPTVISHAVFATALGAAFRHDPKTWSLAALCAVVPDFDVVAFAFRVPYASLWGHRGITHSILFAAGFGLIVAALTCRFRVSTPFWQLAALFTVATFSHPLLDMLTNGGLGVALFAPFNNERYFAPWRPILVSPIGTDFFSWRGAMVLGSELLWIWLPACALVLVSKLVPSRRRKIDSLGSNT